MISKRSNDYSVLSENEPVVHVYANGPTLGEYVMSEGPSGSSSSGQPVVTYHWSLEDYTRGSATSLEDLAADYSRRYLTILDRLKNDTVVISFTPPSNINEKHRGLTDAEEEQFKSAFTAAFAKTKKPQRRKALKPPPGGPK